MAFNISTPIGLHSEEVFSKIKIPLILVSEPFFEANKWLPFHAENGFKIIVKMDFHIFQQPYPAKHACVNASVLRCRGVATVPASEQCGFQCKTDV
jgi:hypothetical protein